jgi:hypothetical protein
MHHTYRNIEPLNIEWCLTSWTIRMTTFVLSEPWMRFKLTTLVMMGTDCTDSCKSNYHMITATTIPGLSFIFVRVYGLFWVGGGGICAHWVYRLVIYAVWKKIKLNSEMICFLPHFPYIFTIQLTFSSIFSKSFHYSTYLFSILSKLFHY